MDAFQLLVLGCLAPTALYFLVLVTVGFFSRILFDAVCVFGLIGLLMAFLAVQGTTALLVILMMIMHVAVTMTAHRQLKHLKTEYGRRKRRSVRGGAA